MTASQHENQQADDRRQYGTLDKQVGGTSSPLPHCSWGVGFGSSLGTTLFVDEELRPVLQLELPAGHHRVTLFDAAQDRRLVAPLYRRQ